MKAIVYAVKTNNGWQARISVAWEVDVAYWSGSKAIGLLRLRETLPLGLAEAVCSRLSEAVQVGVGGRWTTDKLADEMRRLAEVVWETAERENAGRRAGNRHHSGLMGGRKGSADRRRDEAYVDKRSWSTEAIVCGEKGVGARDVIGSLSQTASLAADCLRGRSLLREEASAMLAEAVPAPASDAAMLRALQLAALRGGARLAAAIAPADAGDAAGWRPRRRRQGLRCRRCGSGEERMRRTACASCGRSGCAVCEACAALGRSRECGLLVLGIEPSEQPKAPAPGAAMDRWGLSPAQQDASAAAVRFLREAAPAGTRTQCEASASTGSYTLRQTAIAGTRTLREAPRSLRSLYRSTLSMLVRRPADRGPYGSSFLLWAVTGAGKTEMIFPLLDAVLSAGGRALVATPRRDVVLELAPRLAKAFPNYSRAVLYGGSEDRWANAALTLATTHQLMRFQGAFDLVLIDELDAFPYHNDPLLHYAAAKSRKPAGTTVLLSATPPAAMQRAVKRGRLRCAKVPVRYHRHPLPEPARIPLPPLQRWLRKGKLPSALGNKLRQSIARGAQVFVFVPYIRHVQPLVELLRLEAARLQLSPEAIGGTSSTDPERAAKVTAFRQADIRLLVTTTILERGVTIPRSDVFILDAHQQMFDEAALVQMAGRAGRSADDPRGRVFFCSAYRTSNQRGAERQIRSMNRIARRRGYLLGKEAAAK